jgi:hypothetical protein
MVAPGSRRTDLRVRRHRITEALMLSQRFTSRAVLIILVVWCATALILGAIGAFEALRPPLPQAILFGLVALLLAAYRWAEGFRLWISSIPIAWLVSVHLVRFVGIYFLWLHQHGQLPFAFAVPGGWGDIVVATLALLLLITRPISRAVYFVWNSIGFVDILFVVATATKLALADFGSMAALLRLPLSLLPTFIVPLIIFTHVVIFVRLRNARLTPAA